MLLGAGGAAKGLLDPLLETGIAELVIANRTTGGPCPGHPRRKAGAEQGWEWGRCAAGAWSSRARFDLIINATSAGLDGSRRTYRRAAWPPVAGPTTCFTVTMPPPFAAGARTMAPPVVLDGLGMLVEQAAEAFWLWRGVSPQTAPVIALLRAGPA